MMRKRYRRIVFFFARLIAWLAICDIVLPWLGFRSWAQRTRPERLRKAATQFRSLAIQMGGVMIKVGQFMSTRADVLPVEITRELAGLQDEVPPERFEDIRQVAEKDLGRPLEQEFVFFDPNPVAAASLGQVHQARLWQDDTWDQSAGREAGTQTRPQEEGQVNVVVKIQRPNIEQLIATDVAALQTVGKWLSRYPPIRKRADVPALLAEFGHILGQEIDYIQEGNHAETFAANFKEYAGVRVPRVAWSHTTRRVLTLEDVTGIKIADHQALAEAGIQGPEVASRLLTIYLKQIFDDGFFHADPHPGNLFINVTGQDAQGKVTWELVLVDFGMVGTIPPNTRHALREMIVAVGTQDSPRLVRAYQTLGALLPSADIELLERAQVKAFEQFWGKSMTELLNVSHQEIMQLAHEFRGLIYDMPFQVPHNLIFLGRAVGLLSGMCTGLDPDFNFWAILAPYAQRMVTEEVTSPKYWFNELGQLVQKLLSLPQRTDAVLAKMEQGKFTVQDTKLTVQLRRLEMAVGRVAAGIVFAAMLLGSILLFQANSQVYARILLAGALISLAWIILARPAKDS